MKLSEFTRGKPFACNGKRYLCTDIGSRVVVAIPMAATIQRDGNSIVLTEDETMAEGWLNGPPYAQAEIVFDEDDQVACEPA